MRRWRVVASAAPQIRHHQHTLPQIRQASGSAKIRDSEVEFFEQCRQRFARPKLDMLSVHQRRIMIVHFPGQRQSDVLQVAMIRR